ncbi:hypothetical protein [Carboxylicivirga marina]|uniref:hypothetical protein n=1 Tax=Carboxylicivirga marina TaxID=2800988 RepID=UPI002596E2FD|nr:hypothetical protein [uncultured Carboxylicivirga sp.]
MKATFLIIILVFSLDLFAQNPIALSRIDSTNWIFYDNLGGPILKKNIDETWADTLTVEIEKLLLSDTKSELHITGNITIPITASPWSPQTVILTGIRKDTVVQNGFINDYTGVHQYDNPAIIIKDSDTFRFETKQTEDSLNFNFNYILKIRPEHNVLVIGKDVCYGIIFDINNKNGY